MKRKDYGSLSYRKAKKLREDIIKLANTIISKPSVEKFWGIYDVIRDHILPFIDEWTTYNLARVDKTCSKILRDSQYTNNGSIYSLLTQHFAKNYTCCICFGKIKTNAHVYKEDGLYCHYYCLPVMQEWTISSIGIPSPKDHTSVGMIFRGYEYKNPCFNTNITTLSYHLETVHPAAYSALYKEKNNNVLHKYKAYFDSYYKDHELNLLYDTNKKVTFGGVRISVYMVFNHLYPDYYTTHTSEEIASKFREVEHRIKHVHNSARIYHATHIRPYLLESSNWGTFLKSKCLRLVERETFIGFIFSIGGFAQPENINKCMQENLVKVRKHTISMCVTKSFNMFFSTIACQCSLCKKLTIDVDRSFLTMTINEMADVYMNSNIISSSEIRDNVFEKLAIILEWWVDARDYGSVGMIAFLILRYHRDYLNEYLNIALSLLKNNYHPRDIQTTISKINQQNVNYNWFENNIIRMSRYRQSCYCGRKNTILANFCTRHNLCIGCCGKKQCKEESLLAETDSDSSDSESSDSEISIVNIS